MKKEFSKCCKYCGVEWNDDWSNKQPKRAMCRECGKKEYAEYQKKYNSSNSGKTRMELYQPYKLENRREHWKEINQKLRGIKDREEWREFMGQNLMNIMNDEKFLEYLTKQPQ